MGLGCTDLLGCVISCHLTGLRSKSKLFKKLKPSHVTFRSSFQDEITGETSTYFDMG